MIDLYDPPLRHKPETREEAIDELRMMLATLPTGIGMYQRLADCVEVLESYQDGTI